MYIDSITMREFRTFKRASIDFVHPDARIPAGSGSPKFANMNLVIGGNGCGKTTLLKGIALAALGPAVADSGLFPYHLLNYAVACKPCNSGLKKSYFPISDRYDTDGEDPRKMGAEKPWLLYPIGRFDIDPEEVITFHGLWPDHDGSAQPRLPPPRGGRAPSDVPSLR